MNVLPTPTSQGRGFFILVRGAGGIRAAAGFIDAVEGLLNSDPALETQDVVERSQFGCFLNKKTEGKFFEKKTSTAKAL